MLDLRDDIASEKLNTMVFTAFEKLYQRRSETAENIEGHLSAFAEEGFNKASFQDQRAFHINAKCLIVGGTTPNIADAKWKAWIANGFSRRFLWLFYKLDNPLIIQKAISKWQPIDLSLDDAVINFPQNFLPIDVSDSEDKIIQEILKEQAGKNGTGYILMKKILTALKWRMRKKAHTEYDREEVPRRALAILKDCASGFKRDGGRLSISEERTIDPLNRKIIKKKTKLAKKEKSHGKTHARTR